MDSSVTVDASEPIERDANAPTDLGAVADATDVMTTESSDMGIQPDAETSDACAGEGCESVCEDDCVLASPSAPMRAECAQLWTVRSRPLPRLG